MLNMVLEPDEVKKIAHLARIALDEEKIPEYSREMSSIVDFVGQMSAINVDGVEPLANPLDQTQRLRADVITETNQRDALQAIAPSVEDGLFRVPRVIE
jgi:aspartyl-tRNA(Asn)/glutamyl-tRNA(Gln) amidotransferase subunit C